MDKAEKQRILAELTYLSEEVYDELLGILLLQTEEKIRELKTAAEHEDFSSIAKIAHSLKGSSGNLRVNTIYEPAKSMESIARENPDKQKIVGDILHLEEALLVLKAS
jgi:HPt (histidine-containing phosphotransfer) domain-containing protein